MRKASLKAAVVLGLAVCYLVAGGAAGAADNPSCEPGKIATKYPTLAGKTVKFSQDGQSPPFTYRDPKNPENIIGLDADLVRAAAECIGVKPEFFLGAWSGLLPALIAGQSDVMWSNLYYSPARAKQVNFVTYLQAATAGLVRKGNPKNIKSLDDFCGVRTTAGLGTVEYTQLQAIGEKCVAAGKKAVEIVTFPDVPAGARLIANDRADVLLGDLVLAGQFVQENPDQLEIGFKINSDIKIGIAVRKTDEQLLQALHEAVRVIQSNGTEKALLEKYHMDPSLQIPAQVLKE
jgi:polar amino acid transport system substrate-binding protein